MKNMGWCSRECRIQCVTDGGTWGDVLHSIGNLTLLNRSDNRSIKNHADLKADCYKKSHYVSTKELADIVGGWNQEAAEARQKWARDLLCAYLYGDGTEEPEGFVNFC